MSFDTEDTTEEHERRIVRCKTCRARIIFLPTDTGKNMPIDADSVDPDDDQYQRGKHVSHFQTCQHANQHRRPR